MAEMQAPSKNMLTTNLNNYSNKLTDHQTAITSGQSFLTCRCRCQSSRLGACYFDFAQLAKITRAMGDLNGVKVRLDRRRCPLCGRLFSPSASFTFTINIFLDLKTGFLTNKVALLYYRSYFTSALFIRRA